MPMPRPFFPTIAMALSLLPITATATEVQVRVTNMADDASLLRVELCGRAEWLKGCAITAAAPAGTATVTIPNVPPGEYGVIAHHDSDGDGEVNRNLLGIPTEGIGFSRAASIRLGAPRFDDAALPIQGDRTTVDITLRFERAR